MAENVSIRRCTDVETGVQDPPDAEDRRVSDFIIHFQPKICVLLHWIICIFTLFVTLHWPGISMQTLLSVTYLFLFVILPLFNSQTELYELFHRNANRASLLFLSFTDGHERHCRQRDPGG